MDIIITNPRTNEKMKLSNHNGLCYGISKPCKGDGLKEWAEPKNFPTDFSSGIKTIVKSLMREDPSSFSFELSENFEDKLVETEEEIINSFVDQLLVEVAPEQIKDTEFKWDFKDYEYLKPVSLIEEFMKSSLKETSKTFSDYEQMSLDYSRIHSAIKKLKLKGKVKVNQKKDTVTLRKL